jgi:hypothetical protein
MMSPTLGSRLGSHCWMNSTVNERPAPIAMARSGRTPFQASAMPNGMKRSRFWMTSATAASPLPRAKLQPRGNAEPPERSVATRMASVEQARNARRAER